MFNTNHSVLTWNGLYGPEQWSSTHYLMNVHHGKFDFARIVAKAGVLGKRITLESIALLLRSHSKQGCKFSTQYMLEAFVQLIAA